MAEFTWGDAALTGQLFGLGGQLFGSFYSAKSQKAQLEAQAAMAETNARISELGAKSALMAGTKNVAMRTLQAGQLKSQQRAALAANGVDMGVGSAAELTAGTDILKEIDVNQIEANALSQAWGYRTQATDQRNQALMARAQAKGINPIGNAFNTLLTGAGSVAQSWYQMNKQGALSTYGNGGGDAASQWLPANQYGAINGMVGSGSDPIFALGTLNNWWK